jgi:HlyD family secretion protein
LGRGPGGSTKKDEDVEGVFVVGEDNILEFCPVEVGIAGEERFEVVSGLEQGARVVSGPFRVLRTLDHDDEVKVVEPEDEDED